LALGVRSGTYTLMGAIIQYPKNHGPAGQQATLLRYMVGIIHVNPRKFML